MNKAETPQKTALEIARPFLGKNVHVVFDRPLGSTHPRHGFLYEVNYGYIPGVTAADGEDLDAYFLGTDKAFTETDGIVIAIVHRENDDDDKLVVVPPGTVLTDEEILHAVNFQEQFFKSRIVRE